MSDRMKRSGENSLRIKCGILVPDPGRMCHLFSFSLSVHFLLTSLFSHIPFCSSFLFSLLCGNTLFPLLFFLTGFELVMALVFVYLLLISVPIAVCMSPSGTLLLSPNLSVHFVGEGRSTQTELFV